MADIQSTFNNETNIVDTSNLFMIFANDHVMCTANIIAKVDNIRKVRDQHFPSLYGIHHCATLGDLRKQIKDLGILLGVEVIERDRLQVSRKKIP